MLFYTTSSLAGLECRAPKVDQEERKRKKVTTFYGFLAHTT